jgi:hypothetical protein
MWGVRTLLALVLLAMPAFAADKFLGWQSCASSGCHGGGKGDDQVLIWRKSDPHSRAYGTLISARSMRMAEALGLIDTSKPEPVKPADKPATPAEADEKADPQKAAGTNTEISKGDAAKLALLKGKVGDVEAVDAAPEKGKAPKKGRVNLDKPTPPPGKPEELKVDPAKADPAKPEPIRYSAAKSEQCTVCHSPMQSASKAHLAMNLKNANHGISCEVCHGPAENYIRFHTRLDITHAQRVSEGLRDLDSHYAKANTCVGCHANLSPEILTAGHPTLRFELARQLVEETPHWKDFDAKQSAGAWLTSQATLLRELAWLAGKPGAHKSLEDRIAALRWVLSATELGGRHLGAKTGNPQVWAGADALARAASAQRWNERSTRALFEKVMMLRGDLKSATPQGDFARAEVLVPALRALVLGMDPKVLVQAKAPLDALDLAIRSSAVYDPKGFDATLGELATAMAVKP